MPTRALETALQPNAIALIGATERKGSAGAIVARNLLDRFKGELHFVNPNRKTVFGRETVRDIASLPVAPDLAVIATPAPTLLGIVDDLAKRGAKAAVILTDARRGTTPAADLRRALTARAHATGMRLFGPNALGLSSPGHGLHATMTPLRAAPGTIGFVGQSITAAGPIVDWALAQGIGFSHLVSLGDMADVDYADMLDFFANDARTRTVVLFVERLPNPRSFLSAARAAARAKPVLVIKAGIAGENRERDGVYDAAFKRAGILRCRTLEDLFAAIEALAVRLPADALPATGSNLAIVANGESMAALAADTMAELGGHCGPLPAETAAKLAAVLPPGRTRVNPIDILPDADGARYENVLRILLDDKSFDAVLVLSGPSGIAEPGDTAAAVARAVGAARQTPGRRRPWVMTSWPGGASTETAKRVFAEHHIPHFATPSVAVRAFLALVEHQRIGERLTQTPEFAADLDPDAMLRLKTTLERSAANGPRDFEESVAAQLGAVLGVAPQTREPPVGWRIAVDSEPDFGPVIRFGLGGAAGRLVDESAVALLPLNATQADDLIDSQPLVRRIAARGGMDDAQRRTLRALLVRVADLVAQLPEIVSLAIDPLTTVDGGPIAGIAGRVAPFAGDPHARFVIRPYPRELEAHLSARNGEPLLLRPLRAEDEPALHAFFARLSPEDMRLRFFQPLKSLTHTLAARLTQLDYDREMAFVLLPLGEREPYGAVRLHRDAEGTSGEFAITVRTDFQGRGFGVLLMERMLAYARAQKFDTVFGLVLRENEPMLALSRRLGFALKSEPGDPSIVRVEKKL